MRRLPTKKYRVTLLFARRLNLAGFNIGLYTNIPTRNSTPRCSRVPISLPINRDRFQIAIEFYLTNEEIEKKSRLTIRQLPWHILVKLHLSAHPPFRATTLSVTECETSLIPSRHTSGQTCSTDSIFKRFSFVEIVYKKTCIFYEIVADWFLHSLEYPTCQIVQNFSSNSKACPG